MHNLTLGMIYSLSLTSRHPLFINGFWLTEFLGYFLDRKICHPRLNYTFFIVCICVELFLAAPPVSAEYTTQHRDVVSFLTGGGG